MADAETFRRLALSLPDVEEGTSYGTPSWKVRGKFIARLRDNESVAVVKVDKGEKQLLLEAEPDVFFETPHYYGYGYVLVRLEAIDAGRAGRGDRGRLAPRRAPAPRQGAGCGAWLRAPHQLPTRPVKAFGFSA